MKMFFMSHEIVEFENSSISWLMKTFFMSHEIEPSINVFFHGWWKIVKMDFMACFHGALLFDMIFKGNSWPMKVPILTFMGHEKYLPFFHRNFMATDMAMKIIFASFMGHEINFMTFSRDFNGILMEWWVHSVSKFRAFKIFRISTQTFFSGRLFVYCRLSHKYHFFYFLIPFPFTTSARDMQPRKAESFIPCIYIEFVQRFWPSQTPCLFDSRPPNKYEQTAY